MCLFMILLQHNPMHIYSTLYGVHWGLILGKVCSIEIPVILWLSAQF